MRLRIRLPVRSTPRSSRLRGSLHAALLVLALTAAACGGDGTTPNAAGSPLPSSPAPTSPTSPPSPSPSEPSLPPIPDGNYETVVEDADRTFFGKAPATIVLTLQEGTYELTENGVRFESGVYSGSGQHIMFKALVGSCAGLESEHEYDWALDGRKLTFSTDAGHVCIGRLILFTEFAFTKQS